MVNTTTKDQKSNQTLTIESQTDTDVDFKQPESSYIRKKSINSRRKKKTLLQAQDQQKTTSSSISPNIDPKQPDQILNHKFGSIDYDSKTDSEDESFFDDDFHQKDITLIHTAHGNVPIQVLNGGISGGDPYGSNKSVLSEEMYLLKRQEQIRTLLNEYTNEYFKLKKDISLKYKVFVEERQNILNKMIQNKNSSNMNNNNNNNSNNNDSLTKEKEKEGNKNSLVEKSILTKECIDKDKLDYTLKMRILDPSDLLSDEQIKYVKKQFDNIKLPERPKLKCKKVEKYGTNGELLCSHGNCMNKRLYLSEFCIDCILYDENQCLYTPDSYSESNSDKLKPVLLYSNVDVHSIAQMGSSNGSSSNIITLNNSLSSNKQKGGKKRKRYLISEDKKLVKRIKKQESNQ